MSWIGNIVMKKGTADQVEKVCNDIANRDSSFSFNIEKDNLKIYGEKDRVWKRILWLTNRVELLKDCKFRVYWSG